MELCSNNHIEIAFDSLDEFDDLQTCPVCELAPLAAYKDIVELEKHLASLREQVSRLETQRSRLVDENEELRDLARHVTKMVTGKVLLVTKDDIDAARKLTEEQASANLSASTPPAA